MATKTKKTPSPQPKPISYGSEVKCQKCQGMVNHNGCAETDCPVKQR